jgi:hypothetical protein
MLERMPEAWMSAEPKRKPRRSNVRQVTIHGERVLGAEEAAILRVEISRTFRARQQQRLESRVSRFARCPERLSVAKAMFAVEQRLVEALWTLARLPNDRGIGFAQRNGVGYLDERSDLYANAVANGGWLTVPPKPAPPSAKAIDAMHEPMDWLAMLDRSQAKLLTEGAMSRRGDMANPVRWSRIRKKLELEHLTVRTLQRRYEAALRIIVSELTIASASRMSHKCG